MKISKLLSVVCVFAFCASFNSVRAQDNAAQAAARDALMKQMNQLQAPEPQPSATTTTVPAMAPVISDSTMAPALVIMQTNSITTPPVMTPARMSTPTPVPIIAPGLPISATKEQRLQSLLLQYKADHITPEQYHTQRAAILAEP